MKIYIACCYFWTSNASASENIKDQIECFQNENLMDDTLVTETLVRNLSLEIEVNKVTKKNDERFILNLQKLHAQRLF